MGKVSFSVYLIHIPIISTLGVFSFQFLFDYFQLYIVSSMLAILIIVGFTYLCSIYFYKYIDNKSVDISNLIAKKFSTTCFIHKQPRL